MEKLFNTPNHYTTMSGLNFKKSAIIFVFWLIGWILCGATVAIGRNLVSMETTLIIHAILAPIFFGTLSFIYHNKFNYTSPLKTAIIFVFLIILVDAALVAPVFEKSYDMFRSFIGTWLVFILVFLATYLVGLWVSKK